MNMYTRPGSPDPGDPHEPADDDDAVARFFAAERESLRPELAGDLDWARITRGARKRGAGRFRNAVVAAAAVAVVAGFGVWTVQQSPADDASQLAAQTVTSSTAAPNQKQGRLAQGSTPNSMQKKKAGLTPSTQTAGFTPWSISNAGKQTIFSLGGKSCAQMTCPTLRRSDDNGASWRTVHTFPASSGPYVTPGPSGVQDHSDQIREVRFVTPSVGYVFGGDLLVTRDGGQTFSQVAHVGQTVLGVEASQGRVVVVSAGECTEAECTGIVSVTQIGTSADVLSLTGSASTRQIPSRSTLQLIVQGDQTLLSITNAADSSQLLPMRLTAGVLKPLSSPAECMGTVLQSVTAASSGQRRLFALCDPQKVGSQTSYTLVTSTDGGDRWTQASSGKVRLPSAGLPHLAAIDVNHLAVTVGATSSGTGGRALIVSTDGGRSFTAKDGPLNLPETGIDWIASPGGRQYYAVTLAGQGYYWSTDAGQTWQLVTPAG